MRSRILVVVAAVSLAACSDVPDPSLVSGPSEWQGAKPTADVPSTAVSCLGRTRAGVVALGAAGVLDDHEQKTLESRLDVVLKQIERGHEKPANNVADSYNHEVEKLEAAGRITADQAKSITLKFECLAPVAIAAGETHTCVLLSDGSVWCWGNNNAGQLGNGSTSNSSVPVLVTGLAARQLDAGGFNTCAVTIIGEPYCWGRNEWGQLGNGTLATSTTPTAVSWPVSDAVAQLTVGWALACGRTAGGETYCWGQNSSGGVGSPATTDFCSGQFCALTPVRITTARTFIDVDVGILGGCALDAAGAAYCWGIRSFGSIGDGVASARCTIAGVLRSQCASEPTPVAGEHQFRSIQFGAQYVCAIRTDDQTMCWGSNDGGQLGVGSFDLFNSSVPLLVTGGLSFASTAAVDASSLLAHACALSAAGDAYCWGWNENGQLGTVASCQIDDVELSCATSPVAVSGGYQFKQLAIGRSHSCGLTTDDKVLCWGGNNLGQLGDGTTEARSTPTPATTSWLNAPVP